MYMHYIICMNAWMISGYECLYICRYNENSVWIGFDVQKGKLDCDEPEDCLTKCYAKPTQEKSCKSGALVYLQCG